MSKFYRTQGCKRIGIHATGSGYRHARRLTAGSTGQLASMIADAFVNKGVPARQIGWMSEFGEQLDLPLHGSAQTTCPHTGRTYVLQNGQLSPT